ncbi:MAG: methionine synthase, partial [Marmoricola sp.]
LLRGAGARAVSVEPAVLAPGGYEPLGQALDAGERVFLGVVPSVGEAAAARATRERVVRFLDMLGFDAEHVEEQLVLTPACGLAGASPAYARQAVAAVREAAGHLPG